MKDRIKLIMEKENLTSAKFADLLQINRAIISHILNGRNNPSLDVVSRILSEMDYINSEWLINGTGEMYKEGHERETGAALPDLFHQAALDSIKAPSVGEHARELKVKEPDNMRQSSENKIINASKVTDRKITQIIIYYDDNTFEIFGHHQKLV